MRHNINTLIALMSFTALMVACSVSPDEETEETGGSGGSTSTSSSGGSAGEAGTGGSAGSTSTGGSGGQGGVAPEFFSCEQVEDGHLVLKVRIEIPPPKYFAADGCIEFPAESGFENYPQPVCWGPLFASGDVGPTELAADIGEIVGSPTEQIPSGTKMTFAPGYTDDPNLNQAFVVDTWVCPEGVCTVDLLCCYGSTEVGRQVDGEGDLEIVTDELGHTNPACTAP